MFKKVVLILGSILFSKRYY